MYGSLIVENVLGMRLHVNVENVEDAFAKMRMLGAQGWRSGTLPERILEFPLALADRFDWSLIGAREFMLTDKETGEAIPAVEYRGEVYKRRHLPANPRKNMPEAVKYSRGAHKSDPPEIVEDGGGEFRYVTLAIFRGNAPVQRAFCKPTGGEKGCQPARRPEPQAPPSGEPEERAQRPAVDVDALLAELPDAQRRQIRALAEAKHVAPARLAVFAGSIAGGMGKPIAAADVPKLIEALKKDAAA